MISVSIYSPCFLYSALFLRHQVYRATSQNSYLNLERIDFFLYADTMMNWRIHAFDHNSQNSITSIAIRIIFELSNTRSCVIWTTFYCYPFTLPLIHPFRFLYLHRELLASPESLIYQTGLCPTSPIFFWTKKSFLLEFFLPKSHLHSKSLPPSVSLASSSYVSQSVCSVSVFICGIPGLFGISFHMPLKLIDAKPISLSICPKY